MRSQPHPARSKNISVNLTPMIDMVFLLIIFFIVSSSMVQQELGIPIDLPSAKTGEVQKDDDPSRKIILTVLGEDHIMLGSQQIGIFQLRQYLTNKRKQSRKPLKVWIRAERMTPYGTIEPIMIACLESGVPDVSFSVIRGK